MKEGKANFFLDINPSEYEQLSIKELSKDKEGKYRLDPNRFLTRHKKKIVGILSSFVITGSGIGHYFNRDKADAEKDKFNLSKYSQYSPVEELKKIPVEEIYTSLEQADDLKIHLENTDLRSIYVNTDREDEFEKELAKEEIRTWNKEFHGNKQAPINKFDRVVEDLSLLKLISEATSTPTGVLIGVALEESGYENKKCNNKKSSAFGIMQINRAGAVDGVNKFLKRVSYLEKHRDKCPQSEEVWSYLLKKRNEIKQSLEKQTDEKIDYNKACYNIIHDKENNILIGSYLLNYQIRKFNGNVGLGVLAYHEGRTGVLRLVKKYLDLGKDDEFDVEKIDFNKIDYLDLRSVMKEYNNKKKKMVDMEGKNYLLRAQTESGVLVRILDRGVDGLEEYLVDNDILVKK